MFPGTLLFQSSNCFFPSYISSLLTGNRNLLQFFQFLNGIHPVQLCAGDKNGRKWCIALKSVTFSEALLAFTLEFNIAATFDPKLLRRRIHLASENDEAIGGWADVVKRETGDQGERSFGGRLQDLDIARRDYSRGLDLILK
jgi:hypothetical protein